MIDYLFDVFDATDGWVVGQCSVSGVYDEKTGMFYPNPEDWNEMIDSYIGCNVCIKPNRVNPYPCYGMDNKTGLLLAENDGAIDYPTVSVIDTYLDKNNKENL